MAYTELYIAGGSEGHGLSRDDFERIPHGDSGILDNAGSLKIELHMCNLLEQCSGLAIRIQRGSRLGRPVQQIQNRNICHISILYLLRGGDQAIHGLTLTYIGVSFLEGP